MFGASNAWDQLGLVERRHWKAQRWPCQSSGVYFWGRESVRNLSKIHKHTYLLMCARHKDIQAGAILRESTATVLINTYSFHPPSLPLHLSCCLDNPLPLRCGQAQILGVLVLLNSGLKSLAGLAHCFQNVWTQLKIATPPLSVTLCPSYCIYPTVYWTIYCFLRRR